MILTFLSNEDESDGTVGGGGGKSIRILLFSVVSDLTKLELLLKMVEDSLNLTSSSSTRCFSEAIESDVNDDVDEDVDDNVVEEHDDFSN